MTDDRQNYELAFHINSNAEEAQILQLKQKLEDTIISQGGAVSFSKEPERVRLSYPIKHQNTAHFSYIHFNAEKSEILDRLREAIKLSPDIIRSLIVKLPSETEKNLTMMKQVKAREAMEKRARKLPKKEEIKGDEKEIEEKLEDIIGNI